MLKKAHLYFTLDVALAVAFVLSTLSGIVLLLVPGGYQGGQNPYYGREVLLLGHSTWSSLHTWTSLAFIGGVAIHVLLHWNWIVRMVRRNLGLRSPTPTEIPCPVPVEE